MIQFNLLPDIKIEFMRAQRNKRMVVAIASLIGIVAVAIVIALALAVFVFQKQHMTNVSKDITKYTNDLGATTDINRILTVQNQLNSLSGLHNQKQNTTKIFPYIKQLTPTNVSISSLAIDFDLQTITIAGSSTAGDNANKVAAVNKFVDTLKFTNYKSGDVSDKAFSEVVLSSLGRADTGASYSISLKFNPIIFSNTESVSLSVPSQVSTRSETEKPNALFEATSPVAGENQ